MIANRPDLCNRFAEYERAVLHAHREQIDEQWGWGVGFFQAGEILLKRRPIDEQRDRDFADMIDDVRSDILIGHVRRATVGSLRTDNTHPFRYRQWLFASTGTVDGFDQVRPQLYETLPKFLRRSLRGDTDSELLFHLFLSFLHDAGKLDRPAVATEDVFPALKSSLTLLDRMARDAHLGPSAINVLLATPEYLVAARRGTAMAYRQLAGREAFEPMFIDSGPGKLRMPDLEPCRLSVVAANFEQNPPPAEWTELPRRGMIAFTRTGEPTLVAPG